MENRFFIVSQPHNVRVRPIINLEKKCNSMFLFVSGADRHMVSLQGFMDAAHHRNIDGWNYGNGDPMALIDNFVHAADEKNHIYDLKAIEGISVYRVFDDEGSPQAYEVEIWFDGSDGLRLVFETAEVYKLNELVL